MKCPIVSKLTYDEDARPKLLTQDCLGTECASYLPDEHRCALLSIALSLYRMAESLQDLQNGLRR